MKAGRPAREFARGLEDERAQFSVRAEHREDGQRESRGLAGAGLGRAHHVLSLQNKRNGLLLDWRGVLVALGLDAVHDRLGQAEVFKSH